jgi:transcriptional regulator with XRE-family HTH domain
MIDNSPQSPSPFISRIFMKPKDMDKIVLPNGLTMKEKRISKGMTIEDVTNIGDLTVGSLEKWERHQDLPNALEVKKLAMAYGMPVDNLLSMVAGRSTSENPVVSSVRRRRDAWEKSRAKELIAIRNKGAAIDAKIKKDKEEELERIRIQARLAAQREEQLARQQEERDLIEVQKIASDSQLKLDIDNKEVIKAKEHAKHVMLLREQDLERRALKIARMLAASENMSEAEVVAQIRTMRESVLSK